MAEPGSAKHAGEVRPSAGAKAAAVVRSVGAGTADLTEIVVQAGGAVAAGTLRGLTRTWGDIVEVTIDGVVAAVTTSTGRRGRSTALGGRRSGARPCLDLIDLTSPAQIDEALAKGLAAAAPPSPSRA